jgi:hypothetical protein
MFEQGIVKIWHMRLSKYYKGPDSGLRIQRCGLGLKMDDMLGSFHWPVQLRQAQTQTLLFDKNAWSPGSRVLIMMASIGDVRGSIHLVMASSHTLTLSMMLISRRSLEIFWNVSGVNSDF